MTKTASGYDISGLGYAAFFDVFWSHGEISEFSGIQCIYGSVVTDWQKLDFQAAGRHPDNQLRGVHCPPTNTGMAVAIRT